LGIPEGAYRVRDLWEHKDLGAAKEITVTLAAHASVTYRARRWRVAWLCVNENSSGSPKRSGGAST
jgi:hypothetical protein